MLPVYMKHYYKDEALFSDTKIVTSVYGQSFEGNLDHEMINKVKFDNIPEDAVKELETPNYDHLIMAAVKHSDGVIIASDNVSASLTKFIESSEKPFYLSPRKINSRKHTRSFIKPCSHKNQYILCLKIIFTTVRIRLTALTLLVSCDKGYNEIGTDIVGGRSFWI